MVGWQALVLLHALFSALQNLQYRAIARSKPARHAALAVNAITYTSMFICGLIVLPLLGEVSYQTFRADMHMFVAVGALFAMALYFTYKGMVHLESAIASVLATSSALFVVILAGYFFDEHLSVWQLVGIAMLVPCLWYVLTLARKRRKLIDFRDESWVKGAIHTLAASLLLAFAHIIERDILQRSNIATYVAFGWGLQLVFAWMLFAVFGRHALPAFRSNKVVRSSLQLGAFRAAAGFFFVKAVVASNNVSLVTVVANFRIVLVAVLAGWLLKERQFYYRKLAAAALSVVALSIIFWN